MAWQHKPWLAGERNGRHRLNWSAVRIIRRSSESCKALGKRFGVAESTVSIVRTGRTWLEDQHRAPDLTHHQGAI